MSDYPDIRDILCNNQPMARPSTLIEQITTTGTPNSNGDVFIGEAVGDSDNGNMVQIRVPDIEFEHITMPSIGVKVEVQAYILLKVISGRTLSERDKQRLPLVMQAQKDVIGEDAAKIVLEHILNDDMNFRDEELIEQCLEELDEEVMNPPVYVSSSWPAMATGPADNSQWSMWLDRTSDTLYMNTNDGPVEISSHTNNSGIENPGTSGTIGER